MKHLLIALALLVGAEGAAQACSCVAPGRDRAQLRDMANQTAAHAIALVEVDVVSAYDQHYGSGELMRVRRTLAGRAPREFRIARIDAPSSASCDVEYVAGSRRLVVIYPAAQAADGGDAEYRDSNLCTSIFLQNPEFRRLLVAAMRTRPRAELGSGSPPAAPCASNV